MPSNLNRIRDALRNNNVVLTRGELKVDQPAAPTAEVLPPERGPRRTTDTASQSTDDPTSVTLKPTVWASSGTAWYESPRYRQRLEAEVHAVKSQFPDARLACLPGETLVWELWVRSLSGARYQIAIQYPSSFPIGEPSVFVLDPALQPSPHVFSDNRLCLGHAFARETSALTTAAWAAAWVSAYEVFWATGSWPEFSPHVATGTRS